MASVVEKVKAKVEQVLHKDHTTTGTAGHTATTGTHGHTATTGTHGHTTTAGPHSSNIANKTDPRVDSDRDGSRNLGAANYGPGGHNTSHTTGLTGQQHTTTAGPHSSNIANKADPRVDSDRDGSHNVGAANYGPGGHSTHTGGVGAHGYGSNTGPHASNIANKADPRVDSDRDGSRNLGAANYGPGGHNTSHTTGLTGQGHNTGFGGQHTTTAGPHDSNLANKLDPRVDSDRDGSRNLGAANYGPGGQTTGHTTGLTGQGYNTGVGGHTTTAGPHDSNIANKVDPRVDSDRDGSRNLGAAGGYGQGTHNTSMLGGAHSGTGPAPTTAGPHSSNLANKLDPRVDSDLDGSKTMGGNPQTRY